MTSPDREPPLSRMLAICQSSKERLELERLVLSAAHKLSFDSGDTTGATLAHKGLCAIIQQQLFAGDGSSTGSVIPASFWQQAQAQVQQQEAIASAQENSQAQATNGAEEAASVNPTAKSVTNFKTAATEAEEAALALASISQAAAQDLQNEVVNAAENLGLRPDSAVPDGGPAAYLDFGGEDQEAANQQPSVISPQQPPQPASIPEPPPPASPSQLIRTQSFYQILGVSNLSSFEEIHLKFLRIMRRLLRSRYSSEFANRDVREFREVLRTICVAHDILKDPNTRTDYDLRQMGMRHTESEEPQPEGKLPQRQRLMVGELLECARILEPTELKTALDMHKAEPGTLFGEFMVQAGFLNQEELDSTLLAQRLISAGKITVAQFQTAMGKMREGGTSFFDTLMTEGWLSPSDIFDENSDLWGTPSTHGSNEQPAPPTRTVKAEPPPWLQQNWSEVDSMAETQSLDVKTLRAVVEVCGDEIKDSE